MKPSERRRWPAKPSALRQAFRELSALTGRPTPDFLKKPQKKLRGHAR